MTNSSYLDDKENIQSMSNSIKVSDDSTKLLKKQTLPSIQRPISASGPSNQ